MIKAAVNFNLDKPHDQSTFFSAYFHLLFIAHAKYVFFTFIFLFLFLLSI